MTVSGSTASVFPDQANGPQLEACTDQLHDSYMDDIAVSEARNNLAEIIEEARRTGEPVYVTRR